MGNIFQVSPKKTLYEDRNWWHGIDIHEIYVRAVRWEQSWINWFEMVEKEKENKGKKVKIKQKMTAFTLCVLCGFVWGI